MTLAAEQSAPLSREDAAFSRLPLAVDLDGTLVAGDTLIEGLIWLLFNRPLTLIAIAPTLLGGRAAFKRAVAAHAALDYKHLPYRKAVLTLIREARDRGVVVHLVSGADQRIADGVAKELGVFDDATGSDGVRNLAGAAKSKFLTERYPEGFHYVGDSVRDRPVWAAAARSSVVARSPQQGRRRIGDAAADLDLIEARVATAKDWIKTLRLHHWVKNTLVFVPVLLGQLYGDPTADVLAVVGFLIFGFVASSGYLVNDLADLAADRAHPRKRKRAIAGGRISARRAMLLAAALAAGGLGVAFQTDRDFALWVAIYFALSLSYSIRLKREPLLDIFIIGMLFTIRLVAGMVILDQPISIWLTGFSFALFSSLAFAKRNGELAAAAARGGAAPGGRGYRLDDRHLLTALGVASAMSAMIVMLLYFQFRALSTGLYDDLETLYFVPLVLFSWLLRVWFMAYRGDLHDDPIIFALKDKISWLHAAAIFVIWQIADKPGFPR